ncbi:MAG: amidohydrolase [Clostridia bacterium]|nr:amidohydrolase [Clostridia bacterium]
MLNRLKKHRRALHRVPELDRNLPETERYIRSVLSALPCEVFSPSAGAVCAYFDAGADAALAFRSDMDALPISEQTGLPFASAHPGCMHACGHDGHMAMLLAFAEELPALLPTLRRNVLLIFQPAEETTGGAKDICESGIFEKYNVGAVFGVHLWPELPAGVLAAKSGAMLSRASEIDVNIFGRGAHIARSAAGRDALLAAVRFVSEAYAMTDGELPEGEPRLLRFGVLESGSVRNAISDRAALRGSLRSFSDSAFDFMKKRLREIAAGVGAASGCRLEVDINEGYPPVINDAALYEAVRAHAGGLLAHLPEPYMIAEDFSFYQQRVPGLFALLGSGRGTALHSPDFDFDESVMLRGVEYYLRLLTLPL